MDNRAANTTLKRLMQDYEQGAIDYNTYRQHRNRVIDEFAGVEVRILNQASQTAEKKAETKDTVSSHRAILTLALVILAVLITYIAIKGDQPPSVEEHFVDSTIMPDEPQKATEE